MSSYRSLKLELLRKDPHCHWCGIEVYDLTHTAKGLPDPHNMATIDHLLSRFSRMGGDVVDKVLACYGCNQKRGAEEEKRVLNEKKSRQHLSYL